MKKMVQMPMLRPRTVKHAKLFGASLLELQEKGLLEDGVPLVVRRMVEHLRKHGEESAHRQNGVKLLGFIFGFYQFSFICNIYKKHIYDIIIACYKAVHCTPFTSLCTCQYYITIHFILLLHLLNDLKILFG